MNPLGWPLKTRLERGIALAALVYVILGPLFLSQNFSQNVLTRTFFMGIVASSLIFLSAYGGMVSLSQTALFGLSGVILGNLSTKGGTGGTSKGLHLGWNPTLSVVVAVVLTTAFALLLGAVSARSAGIYFLMITLTFAVIVTLTLSSVTKISGFSGIGGIDRAAPSWVGPNVNLHEDRLYYIALVAAILVYVLIRYIVRTPFGISLQGIRDDPLRMGSLGYNVALHRTLAFGFGGFIAALAGVLYVWWSGQIAPGNVDLPETINVLIIAVIGGLSRIEGAWVGALAFILMDNYITDATRIPLLGFGGTLFGGRFPTVIGIIFLLIVLVSPGGLMGIWDRGFGAFGIARGFRRPKEASGH